MTATYIRPDGKNRFQIASAAEEQLFSAWLDQEFNRVYSVLNGLNVSEEVSASAWVNLPGTYTQVSSTSFSVTGDMASSFEALRSIQFLDGSENDTYSHIQSASYNSGTGITTVVVYDPVVPPTIGAVKVGILDAQSTALPSTHTAIVNAASTDVNNRYIIKAADEILLADDTNAQAQVYDDGQKNGNPHYALLITLPQPATLTNKLLCVKKIAGSYVTIVSSAFTHSTTTDAEQNVIHTNTYDFQILGNNEAKNNIVLNSIGDCYWFVSNGTNWYEVTPEASETVKGIVRFATTDEMTLTAQQIEDGESLPKNLAVSPYNADIAYMRTDASNMRFASNYIYKTTTGSELDPGNTCALVNGNIIVYSGTGVNIPQGRDANGVCLSKKFELTENHTLEGTGADAKLKLLFLREPQDQTESYLIPILAKDYYEGYKQPTVTDTVTDEMIIWFDYSTNRLKYSTDNGTTWLPLNASGPICEYYGNGTTITNYTSYEPVAFLTRDSLQNIYTQVSRNFRVLWDSGYTISSGTVLDRDCLICVSGTIPQFTSRYASLNNIKIWEAGNNTNGNTTFAGSFIAHKGETFTTNMNSSTAYPLEGAFL